MCSSTGDRLGRVVLSLSGSGGGQTDTLLLPACHVWTDRIRGPTQLLPYQHAPSQTSALPALAQAGEGQGVRVFRRPQDLSLLSVPEPASGWSRAEAIHQ